MSENVEYREGADEETPQQTQEAKIVSQEKSAPNLEVPSPNIIETPEVRASRAYAQATKNVEPVPGAVKGQEASQQAPQDPNAGGENAAEWFQRTAEGQQRPPKPENWKYEQPKEDDELYTAVLLVLDHKGVCQPIVSLDNLNIHHRATPHEVLRMCKDVADQISSVRTVGETIRNVNMLMKQGNQEMYQALIGMVGQASSQQPPSGVKISK